METLAERLSKEIAHANNLVRLYESVPTGCYAARMIRGDIAIAQKAMADGDIVEMVRACKTLMEWKE